MRIVASDLASWGVSLMRESVREFVARENIKRFEDLLAATTDKNEHNIVLKLLTAEKRELAAIEAAHLSADPSSGRPTQRRTGQAE